MGRVGKYEPSSEMTGSYGVFNRFNKPDSEMKLFDTRAYSISDFLEWNETGILQISPDFQRRNVWTPKGKSYLLDTILRGKPIPKIIITQKLEGTRTIRTVVDGQQRLRTIIEFANDNITVSRAHNPALAGKKFSALSDQIQKAFRQYELGIDVLFDLPTEDILDIFARLNSYTVKLESQEKINAKYLGYFKQYAFSYGIKYVKYFTESKILTNKAISRMKEAELAGDLFVALMDGIQTNKNAIKFYQDYEEKEGSLQRDGKRFDEVMKFIGAIYPPTDLAETNWSRIHLFYTLFTSIAHGLYGLKDLKNAPNFKLNQKNIGVCRVLLDEISAKYDEYTETDTKVKPPTNYAKFIDQSRRATTDTASRKGRTEFVCKFLHANMK